MGMVIRIEIVVQKDFAFKIAFNEKYADEYEALLSQGIQKFTNRIL